MTARRWIDSCATSSVTRTMPSESGVVVSTALTLVLVPLLYWMYVDTVGIAAVVAVVDLPSKENLSLIHI